MKIILSSTDIEELINESYSGIQKVTLPKEIEVTLEVDNTFAKRGTTVEKVNPILKVVKPKQTSDEQKRALEHAERINQAQKRRPTMAKAGEERKVAHLG